jgi:hypothetical protein
MGKKKSAPAPAAPAPAAPVPVDATITRASPDISQAKANASLQARSEENKSATLLQTKDEDELKKRQESLGVA